VKALLPWLAMVPFALFVLVFMRVLCGSWREALLAFGAAAAFAVSLGLFLWGVITASTHRSNY